MRCFVVVIKEKWERKKGNTYKDFSDVKNTMFLTIKFG